MILYLSRRWTLKAKLKFLSDTPDKIQDKKVQGGCPHPFFEIEGCRRHEKIHCIPCNWPHPQKISHWKVRVSILGWNGPFFAFLLGMNEKPNCPKCDAVEVVKNGKTRGKQRVKCKNCNFQFTSLVPRGYPPETKARVIELYNHGLSIRAAARLQGVSRSSALNWIKEFAKKNIWKTCSRIRYSRRAGRNVALPGVKEEQIVDMESL